jgi:hypothetical protein
VAWEEVVLVLVQDEAGGNFQPRVPVLVQLHSAEFGKCYQV